MKKLTIDYIREQFEKEGYKLLSEKYVDAHAPIAFICPSNHTHKISFGCWKKGQRCKKCADDNLRKDIKDIKQAFHNEDYILL